MPTVPSRASAPPLTRPSSRVTSPSATTVQIVPFSHLDLFWLGTREECLSRGNEIISRALDLLEKHPDFTYLIETVNFLHHYIDCYPEEAARITRLAATGRLELAPLWSAIYQNLPDGETLSRNILYARRYSRKHFGDDPGTAHFADLPGYTPQFPQIAALAGVRQALVSRGAPPDTPLFLWQGLDGTRIPAWYVVLGYAAFACSIDWHKDYAAMSSGKTPAQLEKLAAGVKHPVIAHWGCDLYAPEENIVLNIRRWNEEAAAGKRAHSLRFSTFSRFFAETLDSPHARALPVLSGELPSSWPNMESCWPDVWPEDIPCENALQTAEFLSAFAHLRGWRDYPHRELEDAWIALLDAMDHNQNSQGGERADRDKLQLKKHSRHVAERIIDRMAWRIASRIPEPAPGAFAVVVFNPLSWRRSGVVEGRAVVYGPTRTSDIGAFRTEGLQLHDDRGNIVPYVQLARHEGLSVTLELAFHATDIPALGYRTWHLVPGPNPINEPPTCDILLDKDAEKDPAAVWRYTTDTVVPIGPRRNIGHDRYRNRWFDLSVDRVTGDLTLRDLATGDTILDRMALLAVEERGGNYIADMTPSGRTFPALIDTVETVDNNAVWCRIRVRGSVYGMPFTQTLTLFADSPELLIENVIHWTGPRTVRLQQVFPYAGLGDTVRYGVPFGEVTYPGTMTSPTGAALGQQSDEIPAADREKMRLCLHWVDIGDDTAGLTIAADHRMWEIDPKNSPQLRAYMVRGINHCTGAVTRDTAGELHAIARPPAGDYTFRYVIRPRSVSFAESRNLRRGWELNRPALATAVGGRHAGTAAPLPSSDSLADLTDTTLVGVALKKAEDSDAVLLRAFESVGQTTRIPRASIATFDPVSETDIQEKTRAPLVRDVRPFEIKTLVFNPPEDSTARA